MIKYSIITPVYNRSDCILRCLESVEKQFLEDVDIEHVVVDDGSNDETPKIVEKFALSHDDVVFISFPKNRGTNAARNAAIARARGEWCILLDSDDYFVPNAIEFIHETIVNSKAGHYCFATDDRLNSYQKITSLNEGQSIMLKYEDFLTERVHGDFVHVVKTCILRQYPFDESLRIYEGIFFMSFYKEAGTILFTNKVVTCRERSRNDSVSWTAIRTNKAIIERFIKADRLYLNIFEGDLLNIKGGQKVIENHKVKLLENELLIKKYKECKILIMDKMIIIPWKLKIIYYLRLGGVYYSMMRIWLFVKFKVFRKKID